MAPAQQTLDKFTKGLTRDGVTTFRCKHCDYKSEKFAAIMGHVNRAHPTIVLQPEAAALPEPEPAVVLPGDDILVKLRAEIERLLSAESVIIEMRGRA